MSFPKGAEGAEVVGAEVVGAEVSNPPLMQLHVYFGMLIIYKIDLFCMQLKLNMHILYKNKQRTKVFKPSMLLLQIEYI